MKLDPYQEWLQISPDAGPPDHYVLLGLPRFQSQAATLQAAFERRFAKVRQYEVGPYGEQATLILKQLSEAYSCLSDPGRREIYDTALRETLAIRATSVEFESPRDTVVDLPFGRAVAVPDNSSAQYDSGDPDVEGAYAEFTAQYGDDLRGRTEPRTLTARPASATPATPSREAIVSRRIRAFTLGAGAGFLALLIVGGLAWIGGASDSTSPGEGIATRPVVATTNSDAFPDPSDPATASPATIVPPGIPKEPEIEFAGTLCKLMVYPTDSEQREIHLLVEQDERRVELVTFATRLPDVLLDYVPYAENPLQPDQVRGRAKAVDWPSPGVARRFSEADGATYRLDFLTKADGSYPLVATDMKLRMGDGDERAALESLRTAGNLTRVSGRVSRKIPGSPSYLALQLLGRDIWLQVGEGWREELDRIRVPGFVSAMVMTTEEFQSWPGNADSLDIGHLQIAHLNTPAFGLWSENLRNETLDGKSYRWLARCDGIAHAWPEVMMSVSILEPDQAYALRLNGRLPSPAPSFASRMKAGQLFLVELTAKRSDDQPKIVMVAASSRTDPRDRTVFVSRDVPVNTDLAEAQPSPAADASTLPAAAPVVATKWPPQALDLPPLDMSDPYPLCTLPDTTASAPVGIAIDGRLADLPPDHTFRMVPDTAAPSTWNVHLGMNNPDLMATVPVARFFITDGQLKFQWRRAPIDPLAEQLRNCFLMGTIQDGTSRIALRRPQTVQFDLGIVRALGEQPIPVGVLPRRESLYLEFELTGDVLSADFRNTRVADRPVGRRISFPIDNRKRVEFAIQLRRTDDGQLTIETGLTEDQGRRRVDMLITDALRHIESMEKSVEKMRVQYTQAEEERQAALQTMLSASSTRTSAERALYQSKLQRATSYQKQLSMLTSHLNDRKSRGAFISQYARTLQFKGALTARFGEHRLILVELSSSSAAETLNPLMTP